MRPIGRVVSGYTEAEPIPSQGRMEDRESVMEIKRELAPALSGLSPGQWVWVLLWFDRADRDRLMVHPRGDKTRPQRGVFDTRSPHRPNPIALELVKLVRIDGTRLTVRGLDALEGTPVVDLKPYSAEVDVPGE